MGLCYQRTKAIAFVAHLSLLVVCITHAGCAHRDVKVTGEWRPANALDATPQPIHDAPTVQYISTPLDPSLRSLLSRWSKQGEVALDYRASSDFSLSVDAANIRATSLEGGITALNRIYIQSGVDIRLEGAVVQVTPRVPMESNPRKKTTRSSKRKSKR